MLALVATAAAVVSSIGQNPNSNGMLPEMQMTADKSESGDVSFLQNTGETTYATVASVKGKNLGKFKITVYTPSSDGSAWGYQTATGVRSKHLKTCAVDPKVIPLGSTIYINGLTLKAVDTGGAVKGKVIDIFYDGSDSASKKWVSKFGTRQTVIKK